MAIESELKQKVQQALQAIAIDLDLSAIVIERSKEKIHGDYATNVAMQVARIKKQNPLVIAENIVKHLEMTGIEKIEIAKPGFINFFMKSDLLTNIIAKILTTGDKFGDSSIGENQRINVEFVSANPTGDLHLGHARGASLGDSICRLYEKAGFKVTREFYVNDAGNQINNLAASLKARYHQAFGQDVPVPENGYHGKDLIYLAQMLKTEIGDKYLLDTPETLNYFMRRGVELELDKLNTDLKDFRVKFDRFSFETEVRASNGIEDYLQKCKEYIYVSEDATWLRTTAFDDDKDRVIIKSDGSYTYLLPDIAYHLDKLSRGYDQLIDILGADHHGYINRMKSALQMVGYKKDILEIELIQMVRLFKDGQEYKMSKRTGNAISLRELCQEVGVDAARYFFVSRAASAHLDFNLDIATEKSNANPVYYAQYAHARLSAVLKSGSDIEIDDSGKELKEQSELALLKYLADFQKTIEDAALTRSPYKMTIYIQKLASLIHALYTECRLIDRDNMEITKSRLALVKASQVVMRNALNLIGVEAPTQM